MSEEEYIRNRLDQININSHYGLMIDTEITKLVRDHMKEKEDNKMKATSVQKIKNVNDVCFDISNDPIEMESKLTIVASTNDDIFAFEFEGLDLLQSCKRAGLFVGWEKDQKIRELEKEKQELREEYEEKIDVLQRKYNLEREANEAHHKFFKQYAGKGTEIEFNHVVGDTDEVSYVIVDKERYQFFKESGRCGWEKDKKIRELEALKMPTIENFSDEQPSSRRDILRCAEKCVCGKREQDYGTPESNFQLIADLWNDYLKKERSSIVVDAKDVAMLMALMKIARIRNGGGSGDSFVDLAGYAACGGEIWAGEKGKM